jgi:accessory gene regulator protein AgrB
MVAVRLFSWLQPGPEHVRGIGYALGVIALLIPLLGLLIAYAVTLLIAVILPGMAFLLAIVPFLLNGGTFHRQQRLRAGLGCWLLAVTLVGLVLIPAARSLVVGPKIEVFRVFHFVRGVASVPSR